MKISTRKLDYYMRAQLMTQGGLAKAAGVCRATINGTLHRGTCSTNTAAKIAKALGVYPAEIVEMEDK